MTPEQLEREERIAIIMEGEKCSEAIALKIMAGEEVQESLIS